MGYIDKLKYAKSGIMALYRAYFSIDKSKFGYCGEEITLGPPLKITNPSNLFLYGDNGIKNATIINANAKFIMKKHSGAADGLYVITGNHAMVLGKFYRSITEAEKPDGYDVDVTVEEDVWIGANVMLLQGVTIGRGCTVAARAVVTKSMPPYCLVAGCPARFIKFKWTIDQILEHESKLYQESDRYTREQLEYIFAKYQR